MNAQDAHSPTPISAAALAHALFDECGDALFLVEPETDRILDVNPAVLRLTGFSRQELLQSTASMLFRFETRSHSHCQRLRGAFAKTVVFHGQDGYLLRTAHSGGWIPVSLTVSRLHLRERTVALITARDERERRQTLEQLRVAEAELRSVLAHAPAALWSAERVFDATGNRWRFRYVAPALSRLLGKPPSAIDQLFQWFAIVHPEDRPQCERWLKQLLASEATAGETTYRVVTPEHGTRWIRDRLHIVRDPAGKAVRLDGCLLDFTEQQQAAIALRQQHNLLASLFDATPDLICYKDRQHRIVLANAAVARFVGQPLDALLGRTCAEIGYMPDDYVAHRHAIEEEVLASGRPHQSRERLVRADQTEVILDLLVSPVGMAADGRPEGLLIVGRDVTEEVRLAEGLRQSQKLEALGQLAGGIAHDFNNLLTVILGNLELAGQQPQLPEAVRYSLAAAKQAARQAAHLSRQMLGFARRQPLQLVAIDLNALVREEIELLRHSFDPRITIRCELDPALPPLQGDPVQIQQVLMNLCLNARDAMPEGGTLTVATARLPASIAATAWPGGDAAIPPEARTAPAIIRLTVADTGVGMTPEVRARIFDPFFTTKGIGKGTGLGLAVVYGIVRSHGGGIDCQSAPGRGTRFDIYLPVRQATAHQPAAPASTPPAPSVPASSAAASSAAASNVPTPAAPTPAAPAPPGDATILVVDDEPSVREVARLALQQAGYRVVVATDGLETLERFQQMCSQIRLIVLDASMPRLSGRETYQRIRQIDRSVPILFASGHSGEELPTQQPHTAFLHKPFTPSSLVAAVQQLSAGRPSEGQLPYPLHGALAGSPPATSSGPPSQAEETAMMLAAEATVVDGPCLNAVAGTQRSGES